MLCSFLFLSSLPLLILLSLEASLRLGGYGHSTQVFLKHNFDGATYYSPNKDFYQGFFEFSFDSIVRRDEFDFLVSAEKPDESYRIFIFGGSAAHGTPEPAYSFGRLLEAMLEDQCPESQVEVFTLACPAMNSHVMLQAAKACAALEPDLFIVYMGNNEFGGPFSNFDVASVNSSLFFIRSKIRLSNLRLVQLGNSWRNSLGAIFGQGAEGEDVGDHRRQEDPLWRDKIYAHYQANLKDICQAANDVGATAIACTVGASQTYWSSSRSVHRATLSEQEQEKWGSHYLRGVQLEAAGEHHGAISSYKEALLIDDQYAELLFRLALCYRRIGDHAQARDYFHLASKHDLYRSPADHRINEIVQESAIAKGKEGVVYLDLAGQLAANSLHETLGNEFIYDECHLTFEGNYFVAHRLAEAILPIMPPHIAKSPKKSLLTPGEVRQSVGLNTRLLERLTLKTISEPMGDGSSDSPGFEETVDRAQKRLLELRVQARSEPSLCEAYEQAIAARPRDYIVWYRYATLLLEGHDFEQALKVSRRLVHQFQYRRGAHRLLGIALAALGEEEAALKEFHSALELYPDDWASCLDLALFLQHMGKSQEAIELVNKAPAFDMPSYTDEVLKLVSAMKGEEEIRGGLSVLRSMLGAVPYLEQLCTVREAAQIYNALDQLSAQQADAARIALWKEIVEDRPEVMLSHLYLARALEESGETDAAMASYRDAAALFSDFDLDVSEYELEKETLLQYVDEVIAQGDTTLAIATYCEIDPRASIGFSPSLSAAQKLERTIEQYRSIPDLPPYDARSQKMLLEHP